MSTTATPAFTCTLLENHKDEIAGILHCADRILIAGSLADCAHPKAMAQHLSRVGVRFEAMPQYFQTFVQPLKDNAKRLAKAADIPVTFVNKGHVRKETLVQKLNAERLARKDPDTPPQLDYELIAVLAVVEGGKQYGYCRNRLTGRTELTLRDSRYEHLYFYVEDTDLGLLHLRVPTRPPFQLQLCLNGHDWLGCQMDKAGLVFVQEDNCFSDISDWDKAQQLADGLSIDLLREKLNYYAACFCPVQEAFHNEYYWGIWQFEYSTDIVFKNPADLAPLYEQLSREAMLTIRVPQVCQFLETPQHPGMEYNSRFQTIREGRTIKHVLDRNSIKLYDKKGIMLRIETTSNDVTSFKVHRKVEHRGGSASYQTVDARKYIYEMPLLMPVFRRCNQRYLVHLSGLADHSKGVKALGKLTKDRKNDDKKIKGINFFDPLDADFVRMILDPAFALQGFTRKKLAEGLAALGKPLHWFSRQCLRLRNLGIIHKIKRTRRYQLTDSARSSLPAALRTVLEQIIPCLNT